MTNYSFNIQLAQNYGVDEAIMLENIYFWIEKNKANDKHFHNGKYWTYNTAKAFTKLFPFWTEQKIKRLLKRLRELNLLESGNFNSSAYDHTLWYAMTEQSIVYFETIDSTNLNNQEYKFKQSLNTDINTDNKPDIKEKINKKEKATLVTDDWQPDEATKKKLFNKGLDVAKVVDNFINACQAKNLKYINHNRAILAWHFDERNFARQKEAWEKIDLGLD